MPKPSRKRKAATKWSGGAPSNRGVSDDLQRNIQRVVASIVDRLPHKEDRSDESVSSSFDANAFIRDQFASELDLPHVDVDAIEECCADPQQLERLALKMHVQTKCAIRVFEMLDEAGKGVVVLEDLQRVAPDILGDDDSRDDELVQMVNQVDRSGDGLLTKDDMIRIARKVGL